MSKSIVLVGGSGHAKVIMDVIRSSGGEIFGILDDGISAGTQVLGVPVLGKTDEYEKYNSHPFLIAVGNNEIRRRLAEKMDVSWTTAVHPSAVVSQYAVLGEGTVVMPCAVINADARTGKHCIINTGCVVEHDSILGDYVHISPNAALGGTASIGDGSQIGIGACVRNNLTICEGCVIGAGAVVVKDIAEPGIYAGVPAERVK